MGSKAGIHFIDKDRRCYKFHLVDSDTQKILPYPCIFKEDEDIELWWFTEIRVYPGEKALEKVGLGNKYIKVNNLASLLDLVDKLLEAEIDLETGEVRVES